MSSAQIDRSVPLCKPSSLKPFSDNPEKLRRFEQYEKAVLDRRKGRILVQSLFLFLLQIFINPNSTIFISRF